MELIDKSAVVAEIERQRRAYIEEPSKYKVLSRILSFLDTIEVKEVDLDFQMFAKEMDAIFTLPSSETKNTEEEPLNWEYAIAKHFFELGLKSKSSYLSTPNIDDTLKEMGVDPDSKSAKSFKEFYYMALEKFKAQKGEEV